MQQTYTLNLTIRASHLRQDIQFCASVGECRCYILAFLFIFANLAVAEHSEERSSDWGFTTF